MKLEEKPNIIPWPPLLLLGLAGLAAALNAVLPTGLFIASVPDVFRFIAGAAALGALIWDIWVMVIMGQERTNILPHRAAGKLVTRGPFAYSRNPIYLGNMVFLAALALALDNLWFLLAAVGFAVVVTFLAIKREEAHMAARFGEAWGRYKSRVPRWIARI